MSNGLDVAWENAFSFIDKYPPNDAEYIGTVTKGNRDYRFYKDNDNQYWYESKEHIENEKID